MAAWVDYVDGRLQDLEAKVLGQDTAQEVADSVAQNVDKSGWLRFLHSRLSELEKRVFGADQATEIASVAPPIDGTTEAELQAAPAPSTGNVTAPTVPPFSLSDVQG